MKNTFIPLYYVMSGLEQKYFKKNNTQEFLSKGSGNIQKRGRLLCHWEFEEVGNLLLYLRPILLIPCLCTVESKRNSFGKSV